MDQLLSPSLVSVSTFIERTSDGQLFFQDYLQLSPRSKLKSLRLPVHADSSRCRCGAAHTRAHWDFSEAEIHQLSLGISTQECLEYFEVYIPIDNVALRRVMLSPQLRVTTIVVHQIVSNLSNIHITPADIPFRNVEELELYLRDLHSVSRLLRWEDQMFKTCRLYLTALDNAETFFAFFTALASPQRTDSLQSIRLTCKNPYNPYTPEPDNASYDHSVHHLAYRTLSPLASFKHLRELELVLRNPIFLDDRELGELSRNWPLLEELALTCIEEYYGTSVTLGGLLLLLKHCSRLFDLRIAIDAREVPETTAIATEEYDSPEETVQGIEVYNSLEGIELSHSPIRDAHLVADFFATHFPRVEEIDVFFLDSSLLSDHPTELYRELWDVVNANLF